ncbi:hypothetical protein [Sphingobium sp. SA916]|jgi:hypothetical protein|uniref:hypothetical protein n=1 Tax=Sphingobium sp. SA916 TaxID=1851207 RepID=UPI0011AEC834|nr:hypothetical protein [Sphingobium sp. SA916]
MRLALRTLGVVTALMLASPDRVQAGATVAIPVPAAVKAIEGCWTGEGVVLRKPVTIDLGARSILLGAMIAIDVDSRATSDVSDRYQRISCSEGPIHAWVLPTRRFPLSGGTASAEASRRAVRGWHAPTGSMSIIVALTAATVIDGVLRACGSTGPSCRLGKTVRRSPSRTICCVESLAVARIT